MIHSCQWNIMSQPYARQASTTFETVAAEGNTSVALRRKYSCMLSFLRDWTSVIYYRNKLSRDFSMFKPLSLNTDIVSKRGYCNCISRSTIGSIFLSDLIWLSGGLGTSSSLRKLGSLYVSWKLPTYPSPKPILTPMSHLRQSVVLGQG